MQSSSTTTDLLFPLIATAAAASVASLAIFQTDRVSQWTLSPERLMAKRRQEYEYRWKTAIERTHLQLDHCLAGGSDKINADPEINLKKCTYLSSQEEEDSLVKRIVAKKTLARFTILKIDRDPSDPIGDFYVFLMGQEKGYESEFFQAPLISFCSNLKVAFENQLTSTVFCFVADASSDRASGLLEGLMKEAKTGVAVISEPLWMTNLARLAEGKVYTTSKLETVLFSLCRLEAWAVREQVEVSHTVLITLPGQSTVATLLPLVQSVFPEDRHLFAYDGCVASVARGVNDVSTFRRGTVHTELKTICSQLCQNPTRHTVPLPSTSPLTKSIGGLAEALAEVPISQAGVVESWMSSVDAFLRLKDEEKVNGYVPYVLKLSQLTNPVGSFAPSTDSFWILSSLLQFITGTRSRPVPEGIMDAAREFLKDFNHVESAPRMSEAERKAIENCVFRHKSILIENKTLKDTVLPKQQWTLKQSSRAGGCSCCGPEDNEDDDDDLKATRNHTVDSPMDNGMKVMTQNDVTVLHEVKTTIRIVPVQKRAYVDGKMGFAFDPTKFQGLTAS